MNITILGTGAFGLALSSVFLDSGSNVTLWTKLVDEKDMLVREGCNKKALPNYKISKDIKITSDMEEAVKDANIIVIAVPVKFVRATILELKKYYKKKQHICIASKGIEQNSCLFVSNIIKKYIKSKKICAISGGTFAVDLIERVPMGLTLASKNNSTINIVKKAFKTDYLSIQITGDILGVEMYGAIKNVIAIASGIIDGMNFPESTKCMFITKALNDIMNLIYDFGGNKKTFLTYAGIGDLLLTCNSEKSRNYSLGKLIGSGSSEKEINEYLENTTIEGLYTLKSINDLCMLKEANISIIKILYDIVYKQNDIRKLEEYLKK